MCASGEKHEQSTEKNVKNGSWSYEEAFELTGHGWYNYKVLIACSLISVAMALDMFGFAITVAAASCDLDLSISQIGILAGSPFAGLLFAYPWGYYADTRGRRRALLLSTAVGSLFGLLGSFSVNWQMMLVLKVIGCSFSTASFTLTITYLGESTREKNRGQYIFVMMSMNLATEFFSYGLAYLVLPLSFSLPMSLLAISFNSWRLFNIILAAPLGIGALLMLSLEESPKFLSDKGEEDKAIEALKRIFIANGGVEDDFPVETLHSTCQVKEISFCGSMAQQMKQLFMPPLLWRTMQLFYVISLTCSINNAFVMWFPTMLDIVFKAIATESEEVVFCESINEVSVPGGNATATCNGTLSEETIFSGIVASLFFSIINLSVARFASWRRLLLIIVLGVAGLSCVMIIVIKQPIASVIFFSLAQITAVGTGGIASYFVDLYPTSCRSLAPSLGFMLGRLVSLSAVVLIGATVVNHCSAIFYTFAALAFSGCLVSVFLPL
ncbi:unnamed protein product [Leptosia nina]|uniref:Major facilitator superfamily (MFS) profile domain-containing protein n=1 Tax=Leptosia nina TaxID=320188 RepID=A0AAV1J2S3_9NEOP